VANHWLVNPKTKGAVSPSHIYVFVNVPKPQNKQKETQFYIVSSRAVADKFKTTPPRGTKGSIWHYFRRNEKYKDNWRVFGEPMGPAPSKRQRR
jgi:hypothetical protein